MTKLQTTHLQKILRFVSDHGFACEIIGDRVKIEIPYVNVNTDTTGIDTVYVTTFRDAMSELGY